MNINLIVDKNDILIIPAEQYSYLRKKVDRARESIFKESIFKKYDDPTRYLCQKLLFSFRIKRESFMRNSKTLESLKLKDIIFDERGVSINIFSITLWNENKETLLYHDTIIQNPNEPLKNFVIEEINDCCIKYTRKVARCSRCKRDTKLEKLVTKFLLGTSIGNCCPNCNAL